MQAPRRQNWYEGSAVSSSTRRFYHKDARGSITAISNASGNPIQINTYDDWGIPAATNLGRFQYTGQIHIPELDVYYYKARLYSPALGRFMQTDPIGYEDGMNMYDYVGGDPMNFNDPTGLCPSCVGGIVGGILEIAVQTGLEGRSLDELDGKRIVVSIAAGATGAGLAANAGRLGAVAIGSAVGSSQSVANDVVAGEEISATKALASGALGGAGGTVGRGITNAAQGSARTVARSSGNMATNRAGQTATPTTTTAGEGMKRAGFDAAGMVGGGAVGQATPENVNEMNVIEVTAPRPSRGFLGFLKGCFGMCDGIID